MMLPVAILAGGLATRLRPITETTPKVLIEVADKPFICHQLDYLRNQGVKSVVLCIGYLGEMIEKIVGNGSHWGINVTYSFDGPCLLGTGGAIKQALPLLGDHFFILYGDSYLPINFFEVQNAFIESQKLGLMTVFKNNNQWDKSNVVFLNNKILEYNKHLTRPEMLFIDYGLGVLKAEALDFYALKKSFDLSDVYNRLSLDANLAGYEVNERFYEIGSHQGIVETEAYISQKQ
jgi:MurNAc alpha-1-phosphate uridylyltransferase